MSQLSDKTIGCIGNTIKVFAGHYLDLVNPKPEDIDLDSMATALARICRYGGHSPRFYSVAEHCYLATRLAMQDNQPRNILRAVFLHDSVEFALGDIVKPLKNVIGEEYGELEKRMEQAISKRFSVEIHEHYDLYKTYDLQMLRRRSVRCGQKMVLLGRGWKT